MQTASQIGPHCALARPPPESQRLPLSHASVPSTAAARLSRFPRRTIRKRYFQQRHAHEHGFFTGFSSCLIREKLNKVNRNRLLGVQYVKI